MFKPKGYEAQKKKTSDILAYSLGRDMPYEEIFDDFVIFQDGSLGLGISVNPVYMDAYDMGDIKNYTRNLATLFNAVPHGMGMQIIWRKENYSEKVEKHGTNAVGEEPLVHIMTEGRKKFWKEKINQGQIFEISCEIWIRKSGIRSEKSFSKTVGLGVSGNGAIRKYKEEHRALVRELEDFYPRFSTLLSSVAPGHKRMNNEELFKSIWRHLYGSPAHMPKFEHKKPLRSYFSGDVCFDWGFYTISGPGNKEYTKGIMSAHLYPSVTIPGMINCLLTVDNNITVVMNVEQMNQSSMRASLKREYNRYMGLANVMRDPAVLGRFQEIETLLEDMDKSNNLLFNTELYIIPSGENLRELGKVVSAISSQGESYMQTMIWQEKAAMSLCWKASLPGQCYIGSTDRHLATKSDNVADLAPILGPMESAKNPTMLMCDSYGGVFGYDPFDPRLPANHGLIFGSTGSGKSVSASLIMLNSKVYSPRIFIIDKGGSYKKLVSVLGGSYIDPGDPDVSINPLEGKDSWRERRASIILVLEEMIREGKEPTKNEERLILERLVENLYAEFETRDRDPQISDAYNMLVSSKMFDKDSQGDLSSVQKSIIIRLSRWTRTGSQGGNIYSRILDNPRTTISLENDVICFDLGSLSSIEKEGGNLFNVIFVILGDLIQRKVMQDRGRKKILVFDEVWSLLKSDQGAAFLEQLYREMRKYNCMVWAISQRVSDFDDSPASKVLLSQSYQKLILRSNPSEIPGIKTALKLNDGEQEILEKLRSEKGIYSGVFLKLEGVGSGMFLIVPSPVEYWLSTTDAEDGDALDNYINRGFSLMDGIKELAAKYPNGISYAKRRGV